MNKIFTFIFALLVHTALSMNLVNAQVQPTFNLTASNFQYTDSIGTGGFGYDALTFDIYILHTNLAQSGPFEFALGQYYFNVKALPGVAADYTYYMVPGTTTFTNPLAVPRNPIVSMPDATSPTGVSLRVNSNTVLGTGNGPIISNVFPGTRVSTFRFKKKVGSIETGVYPDFFQSGISGYGTNTASAWRLALPNTFTKIFAYVGTLNTDISLQGTYSIEYYPTYAAYNPTTYLYSPANNSTNVPVNVNFIWGKNTQAVKYLFQLASDINFTGLIKNDTIQNITDTVKTVSGLSTSSTYYWRVGSKFSNGTINFSSTWSFTTLPGIVLNLKLIPEGIYFSIFNQLSRRDTMTVFLRNTASPFSKVDSAKAVIDSVNFTGLLKFSYAPAGTYFIAVKHFNSIETWSKSGGVAMNLTDTTFYDFTTAAAQAYGSNLKLKGSKYCAYSGDINQDGIIDASDLIKVYNDSYVGLTGKFLVSDLNGDSNVDASDVSTADNNVYKGVLKITP
ncbi:MAG: hypothetical protein JST15_02960 [Bacteroidetes bacterium]|nr:hypothetical protein [Bacteroidota bacterium]